MGNQQRDIKKSFRLPAELNTRAESLLKKLTKEVLLYGRRKQKNKASHR